MSSGGINLYKKKKSPQNIRISTLFIKNAERDMYRVSAGEEELRRSGKYFTTEGIISFDPTRLGTKFDYAPLQHNKITFKHLEGKALFLTSAFNKHRAELLKAIKNALDKKAGV